jgi:hypothetical protein
MKPELPPEAAGPRLRAIAEQLHRLAPSRTNPHAYFEQKSSMVDELRRLALGLDQVVPRPPRAIPARSRTSSVSEEVAVPLRIKVPEIVVPVEKLNSETPQLSWPLSHCRHCLRRRAQQSRRHRLRLRNVDLFEWADRTRE